MTPDMGVMSLIRGGLVLDEATFLALRDAPDGVARGLRLIVVVALVVGLVSGAVGLSRDLTKSPADQVEEAMAGITGAFDQMEAMGLFADEASAEAADEIRANIEAGVSLGLKIATVVEETTPAPTPLVATFQAIGRWLTLSFTWIGLWLVWGVLTLLFARLLGGTATIQGMLATTALIAAPHVLDAVGWVLCLGTLVRLLAFVWGFMVYVKATSVANRFGLGSALVAVLLPLAIPLLLGMVVAGLVAFTIAVAS